MSQLVKILMEVTFGGTVISTAQFSSYSQFIIILALAAIIGYAIYLAIFAGLSAAWRRKYSFITLSNVAKCMRLCVYIFLCIGVLVTAVGYCVLPTPILRWCNRNDYNIDMQTYMFIISGICGIFDVLRVVFTVIFAVSLSKLSRPYRKGERFASTPNQADSANKNAPVCCSNCGKVLEAGETCCSLCGQKIN